MKLVALSPFEHATAAHILTHVASTDAALIVLPGYASNTPSPEQLQEVLAPGASVFVEGPGGKDKAKSPPHLVTRETITQMPKQCFTSQPKRADMQAFAHAIASRTHGIAGHRFVFVLCGEIIGFNRDGTLKYGMPRPNGIVINPAHTPMGRWHILGEKFRALSRGSLAVHVANNTRKHPRRSTTDVRIYRNGHLVQGRQSNDHAAWCVCKL